jgi:hypothetical protein
MRIIVKKTLAFLFVFVFGLIPFLFSPNITLADSSLLETQEGFKGKEIQSVFGNDTPDDIRYTIVRFIRIVLLFLGVIFLVLIFIAGFKYMTAAGNEEQIKGAIKQITQAAIGLVIVLSSWGISYWILMRLQAAVTATNYMYF